MAMILPSVFIGDLTERRRVVKEAEAQVAPQFKTFLDDLESRLAALGVNIGSWIATRPFRYVQENQTVMATVVPDIADSFDLYVSYVPEDETVALRAHSPGQSGELYRIDLFVQADYDVDDAETAAYDIADSIEGMDEHHSDIDLYSERKRSRRRVQEGENEVAEIIRWVHNTPQLQELYDQFMEEDASPFEMESLAASAASLIRQHGGPDWSKRITDADIEEAGQIMYDELDAAKEKFWKGIRRDAGLPERKRSRRRRIKEFNIGGPPGPIEVIYATKEEADRVAKSLKSQISGSVRVGQTKRFTNYKGDKPKWTGKPTGAASYELPHLKGTYAVTITPNSFRDAMDADMIINKMGGQTVSRKRQSESRKSKGDPINEAVARVFNTQDTLIELELFEHTMLTEQKLDVPIKLVRMVAPKLEKRCVREAAERILQLVLEREKLGWDGYWQASIHAVNEAASGPADEQAARELLLYIENDADLYRQMYVPQIKNLKRKKEKGTYDSELAVKLFMYLANEGARKYIREHGTAGERVDSVFNKNTRMEVARQLRDNFEVEYEANAFEGI